MFGMACGNGIPPQNGEVAAKPTEGSGRFGLALVCGGERPAPPPCGHLPVPGRIWLRRAGFMLCATSATLDEFHPQAGSHYSANGHLKAYNERDLKTLK